MSRTVLTRVIAAATVAGLIGSAPAIVSAASHHPSVPKTFKSALTPAQIQALSQNANQRVIVLLRNQFTAAPRASRLRRANLVTTQTPITGELQTLHARHVHAYSFINAISATMSSAEVARLKTDPAVQAVVPDTIVQASPSAPTVTAVPSPTQGGTPNSIGASSPTEGSGTPSQVCPSNPNEPLLEPEALQSMNVDYGDNGPAGAHSLANGTGVKVAVFPDGLDPNIPDFQRNGQSAIFDYEDFTGEGTTGVTGGEEAFGDASSIISQGNQTFDLSGEVNPAHPLPAGCNIKIEGVAPGASLAVMKVFGDTNFAFNSEILQGLDWAVSQDHVDVLSESFGGNPVPNPGTDPIAVFDQDAVNAGITVVVSSGDAGVTNTIGTPAVDSGVISVGATTDYRVYAQTTSYGYQFGGNGWLSDQISGLSSSGVTEANNTVDVVAPGEANWSDCSTNTTVFTECADTYRGPSPQPIVAFGGTSESAPLTAGVAALVIQAYRDTHGGSTPSPALVKQIIKSTARDINTRAADQGAGLVDALRAVQEARSIGNATKIGDGLLYSTNAINVVSSVNHRNTTDVTVTNNGANTQTLAPSVRALGTPTTIASGTLQLNQATDPTFVYQNGSLVGDVHLVHVTVPANTDRLHAAIAWKQPDPAHPNFFQTIRFDLFDPQGRLVSQSRPQGPVGTPGGGFSEVEIHDAQPGTWTLLVFDTAFAGPDNYTGPLAYQLTSQSIQSVAGSVRPASATLASGQSTTFHVTTTTPSSPGDTSESLVFGSSPAGSFAQGTVPITLRSLAQVGQTFTGTVTGGNSRMSFYGQELPYDFVVQGHHQDIDARIQIANPGYQVLAFLVDPSGTPVDVQSSEKWDGSGTNGQTISLFRQNPQPGTWQLLVVQANDVESGLTGSPFTARLDYDQVRAKAIGLPDSPRHRISPGSKIVAQIRVTNTGNQEEGYLVDARRNDQTVLPLPGLFANPASEPLPISDSSTIPQFPVPPFSPAATIAASSTVPITLDTSPDFGTPDVGAQQFGNSAVAFPSAPELPASIWSCAPAEQGPFATTAPLTTFSCGADALTNRFAPDVSTSAGNIWQDVDTGTSTYNPLVLDPGQTGTITVSLSPTDPTRTKVRGFLALETFNFNTFSSDEVASFPYAYRVGF
jgi:hypothetical protein